MVPSEYQPTSRRPIEDAFRATANGAVRFCMRQHIHPDVISYCSILAAAIAGICFWKAGSRPGLLLVGPAFCFIRLWCNMLDGMVALASGKASVRGEILNDLPDRFSDVLIFVGVAHSGLNAILSGYWAAIFALLTAYSGITGQAVGVQREFSGLMSKPWRMVALSIGAWTTWGLLWRGEPTRWCGLTLLDWTCLVIIVGCAQTIWIRLLRIMQSLKEKYPKKSGS